MSAWHKYKCFDCEAESEESISNGKELMTEIIALYGLVKGVEFNHVCFSSIRGNMNEVEAMMGFLSQHDGHNVIVQT